MTEDGKLDLGDLKAMSCPTISNTMAAEVLRMDPGKLAFYARTGQLGWKVLAPENGSRVIHNREDFIRYWTGEQKEPDPPEITDSDRLDSIIQLLADILSEIKKETACAATQTVRKDWGNEQP